MEYRKLGKTDMTVSAISMGCWGIISDAHWGTRDEADSLATIRAALDVGINFFDTAEAYGDGDSEVLLGKALASRRQQVMIATKVSESHLGGEEVQAACERSLRRLNTDYIDLYQIHWANHSIPIAETAEALMRLREQGKVRAIGVCNFGVRDLSDILEITHCETNQLPYNLIWRAIEYEIVSKCAEDGVAILCYSPLMHGLLTGNFCMADEVPEGRARTRHFSKDRLKVRHREPGCEEETFATIDKIRQISNATGHSMADLAISWLLHHPNVSSVAVGARNPDQLRNNVRALTVRLSPDTLAELDAASSGLKTTLGSNPDLWQSESRFR